MKSNNRYDIKSEYGGAIAPALLWLVGIPLPLLLILWMFGVL